MAQYLSARPSAVCDYRIHSHSSSRLVYIPGLSPSRSLRLPHPKSNSHCGLLVINEGIQIHADSDGKMKKLSSSSSSSSKSKRHVWVNPNSPRAKQLRKQSYDSRYSSLVDIARALDSCVATQEHASKVLMGLGNSVVQEDAVLVLNSMTNPDTALLALQYFLDNIKLAKQVVLYNVTLKVLRKSRDLDRAHQLFDEMLQRGVKPNNATFSTIISCCRICNMPDKAVEWFEKMPAFGCNPDDITYSAMIDAYGKAGNVDSALALYDHARTERLRMDAVTFSTLIKIYVNTRNFDGCLNVYEEMKALGVKPNLVIYNTLLYAMGRAKRPWQANNIYKDMITNGIAPSWKTYAALLQAFCRARYCEDAIKVYKEMKDRGLEFNVILYNALLAACADVGYVDEAVQIYQDMKSSGTCTPDNWTFSSMITAYSYSGQVMEAESVLNEMVEAGFKPTIIVLTSLMRCYGKASRTDDVVRTFNTVFELGITPDDRFCGCFLSVMRQTPKEELSKLVECAAKANQNVGDVVKILLEGEKSEGQFKGAASKLFDIISADVRKIYCNCLIDLCVNLNLLDRACELLDLGLTSQIYTDIQSKTPTQWSLHLKSMSLGTALTSLHVWMNDLMKTVEGGGELPPVLGINTGHGKRRYSDEGLAGVFEVHLKELNAPFHKADKAGWFLTTNSAAKAWLESQKSQS